MSYKLFFQAITKFLIGALLVGALIFVPAGTIKFLNGWIFMGVLFVPMFIFGIYLMFKNPDLLKRRLNAKEKEGEQKTVIALSGLMFMAGFVIAGLNYRFGWVVLPNIVTIIASIVFVISYILYADVQLK